MQGVFSVATVSSRLSSLIHRCLHNSRLSYTFIYSMRFMDAKAAFLLLLLLFGYRSRSVSLPLCLFWLPIALPLSPYIERMALHTGNSLCVANISVRATIHKLKTSPNIFSYLYI